MQGLITTGTTKPLTHRPSRLDSEHTACGLRLDDTVHLHLGEGQTCEQCTHVVEQVAAALRGEPSWAQSDHQAKLTGWGVFDTWERKWCPRRGTESQMSQHAVQLNDSLRVGGQAAYRYQPLPLPEPINEQSDRSLE